MSRAGFEPVQNLSSGFGELKLWSSDKHSSAKYNEVRIHNDVFLENVYNWSKFKACSRDIFLSWTFYLLLINSSRYFFVWSLISHNTKEILYANTYSKWWNKDGDIHFLQFQVLMFKNPVLKLMSQGILHYLWSADLSKSFSPLNLSIFIFSQYFFE